jgi:NitT/TauT family transport system substrate-binding protein
VKDRQMVAHVATERGFFTGPLYPDVTESAVYETIKDLSYDWRDYDPEESVRYHALKLNDAKLVGKTPREIINAGTNLAYYHQLRAELKA